MISYILALISAVFVILIDQITKIYIMSAFSLYESAEFLSPIIRITYIHNTGGAWGMLSGKTWLLVVITALIMIFCGIILIKTWRKNALLFWSLSLVLSGGIGNMIDRIFRNGNVIDFLQFDFYKSFPIFNIADCAIVIGAVLLFIYYLADIIREGIKKKTNGNN